MAKEMNTATIEIFKAGRYGESEGRIWSKEEVQQLADNYDPEFRNAPIILGHNGMSIFGGEEKPAYGWAQKLSVNKDGVLEAHIEYNDDLKEYVDKKMYQRVSVEVVKKAELYDFGGKEGAYLMAIAFLGGSQPAVAGLTPIKFELTGSDEKVESFSLDDWQAFVTDEENSHGVTHPEGGETLPKDDEQGGDPEGGNPEGFTPPTNSKEEEPMAENQGDGGSQEEHFASTVALEKFEAEQLAFREEKEAFMLQKRTEGIAKFMADNSKKIAPAVAKGMEEFMLGLDDASLEKFQGIVTAMPEFEIFGADLTGGDNPDAHLDTDAQVAKQAREDFAVAKKNI